MERQDTQSIDREKPYQKVLRIEQLLSSDTKYSIDELSVRMGIDSRSVFRYLDRLEASGRLINAQIRSGRVKEYWIATETPETPQDLITSLLKMDQSMTEGGVRKYHKLLMQAVNQLDPTAKKLGSKPKKREALRIEIEPHFHLDHGPLAEYNRPESLTDKTMDKILLAIQNQNLLHLQYVKADSKGRAHQLIDFEPYFLSLRVGKLYLVGSLLGQKKLELVSLVYKRIKMVTIDSNRKFERDVKASLDNYYKHCFGQWVPRGEAKKLDITLKVDETWLLEMFHESNFNPQATIETTGKGGLVHLTLFDTPDLESWLFSLHPHAQILQPRVLRDRLRQRATQALALLA